MLQGLAYSVGGGWDSPIDHPGLFVAGGETAAPARFLDELQRVLQVRHETHHLLTSMTSLASSMAANHPFR